MLLSRLLTVAAARAALRRLTPALHSEPGGPRQILADVSVIARHDAGSGIQRVVREMLRQLLTNPPPGYVVRPVYAGQWLGFRHAHGYRAALMGGNSAAGPTGSVRVQAGDIFLGMDLAAQTLPRHHFLLGRWKAAGVKFFFLIYDLLPVLHPHWFEPQAAKEYRNWMRTVSIFADGAICISRSVAEELQDWLAEEYGSEVRASISVKWIHLGADMAAPKTNLSTSHEGLLAFVGARPTVLMVGTVEPRKGYAQALAAFELMWKRGTDVNLVMVGKAGWNVAELLQNLRTHPEKGRRLIWVEDATDGLLCALYRRVDGLLMASEGEGFGLPIVEAARYGKPILARAIPVFAEIAESGASFFSGSSHEELADAVVAWLELVQNGEAPKSDKIEWQTWQESARELGRILSAE